MAKFFQKGRDNLLNGSASMAAVGWVLYSFIPQVKTWVLENIVTWIADTIPSVTDLLSTETTGAVVMVLAGFIVGYAIDSM